VHVKTPARLLIVLLVIGLIIFFGALGFALMPTHTRPIAQGQPPSDAVSIERGRYLAVAADCTACHTAPGGQPFAGGLAIDSPLGSIYSSNITPDKDSGIGNFTLDDFDRAVRHGIDDEGVTLYPAMPYPSYVLMSDQDVAALYDFFMHAVAPASAVQHANGIPWPLSIRWPLAIWRKLFAPSPEAPAFNGSRYPDPVVARGAYLVEGPGHCGTCHTPRGLALQEKALDDSSSAFLSGGQRIGGWAAVNLRGNTADGLGGWSKDDIVATLRTARNPAQAVIGAPMSDVIVHSTQYLNDADLQAIAAYLKTLPPLSGDHSKADHRGAGWRLAARHGGRTLGSRHARIQLAAQQRRSRATFDFHPQQLGKPGLQRLRRRRRACPRRPGCASCAEDGGRQLVKHGELHRLIWRDAGRMIYFASHVYLGERNAGFKVGE